MINFQIYKGGNLIKFETNNHLFVDGEFQTLFIFSEISSFVS